MIPHSLALIAAPLSANLAILSKLAPNMTGMARKNVNSAATARVQPSSRPPMIVDPERDVPGTSERTWKQPMPIAVLYVTSSTLVMAPKSESFSARSSVTPGAKCAP